MVCLSNVTVSCLFDAPPKERVRKDFRRPRFSFFRFNCQTARNRSSTLCFREPSSIHPATKKCNRQLSAAIHCIVSEELTGAAAAEAAARRSGWLISPARPPCQRLRQENVVNAKNPCGAGGSRCNDGTNAALEARFSAPLRWICPRRTRQRHPVMLQRIVASQNPVNLAGRQPHQPWTGGLRRKPRGMGSFWGPQS